MIQSAVAVGNFDDDDDNDNDNDNDNDDNDDDTDATTTTKWRLATPMTTLVVASTILFMPSLSSVLKIEQSKIN